MHNQLSIDKKTTLTEKHKELLYKAIRIRKVEEKLLELFQQGELNGTVHTCVGQELIGIAISEFLHKEDFIVSNHRGHGHYIARTNDIKGLISEVMGKTNGICGGIGGSQHLKNYKYLSNGIQAGMTPIASGFALSYKLNDKPNISVAYIGDGTLGEGILYETLNICGVWEIPILFVVENNMYAQSTSFNQSFSGNLQKRAEGFGIKYNNTNTWDLENLLKIADLSINYVRNNSRPLILEINTYRLNSHSKGDDNRYEDEIEEYKNKDLINKLITDHPILYNQFSEKIDNEIDEAVLNAKKSENLNNFPNKTPGEFITVNYSECFEKSTDRINDIIYEAFKKQLKNSQNTIMLGEDIEHINKWTEKPYGGAFKVSKNLSMLFPERVKNTPISEASIVGIGIGLALNDKISIIEIMFGDFLTLTFDQIYQHASKIVDMYGHETELPLIIRTPMGGKRGYGPTHSQSIEKFFLGIPNLNVIALNHRISPLFLYESIFKNLKKPTLVIENKILYTRKLNHNLLVGFSIEKSDEIFPTIRISPKTNIPSDITIFCYGGILEDVEKAIELAFEEEDILCELICPTKIAPINISPISQSVKQTNKLLIVEEGTNIAALGSEVIAQLLEEDVNLNKVGRIGNNTLIPCSIEAEKNLLPNVDTIFQKIIELTK